MEYVVIKRDTLLGLATRVNELISIGWEPLGGVTITSDRVGPAKDRNSYLQAMRRTQ